MIKFKPSVTRSATILMLSAMMVLPSTSYADIGGMKKVKTLEENTIGRDIYVYQGVSGKCYMYIRLGQGRSYSEVACEDVGLPNTQPKQSPVAKTDTRTRMLEQFVKRVYDMCYKGVYKDFPFTDGEDKFVVMVDRLKDIQLSCDLSISDERLEYERLKKKFGGD